MGEGWLRNPKPAQPWCLHCPKRGAAHMGNFPNLSGQLGPGCKVGEPGRRRAPKPRRRLPLNDVSDDVVRGREGGQHRGLETKGCFPNV